MALVKLYAKPYPVHIHMATDKASYSAWCKAYNHAENMQENDLGCVCVAGDGCELLLFIVPDPDGDYKADISILSHEVMHLVQRTWAYINEDEPGAENEAYYFQHLFGQVQTVYDQFIAKVEHTMAKPSEDAGGTATARAISKSLRKHVEYFKIRAA